MSARRRAQQGHAVILDNEAGSRFFFNHLSPKAKLRKKKSRKQSRLSRRRNK